MVKRPDFVGHQIFDFGDAKPNDTRPINNVIVRTNDSALKWAEETTEKIGEWRALFRSTYISWAVTINGLHLAREKYSDPEWMKNHRFKVSSVRVNHNQPAIVPIAEWDSDVVSDAHMKPIPMLCSYGVIDLYTCLEEFVFDFYEIYLRQNPDPLMQGSEFRDLRQMYRERNESPEVWQAALSERLENWKRKRLYDGLGKVFRAYSEVARLETPSGYSLTTIETWAECIDAFSLLRNCLIHGATVAPDELAEFSTAEHRMGFDFKSGEPLKVSLNHLMNLDCFCDSLLTGLNISLYERVNGKLRK